MRLSFDGTVVKKAGYIVDATVLRPIKGKLLLRPEGGKTQTDSGLILPKVSFGKCRIADVVIGGEQIKEGQKIIYDRYSEEILYIDGVEHSIVIETAVYGILE